MVRYVVGLAGVALADWVLSSHTDEPFGLSGIFGHIEWWWLGPACLVEGASLGAFARVQYELLGAGGVRAPQPTLLGLTLASQAITNSLPAGTAVAAVYGFRWYRRFGADDSLAAWSLVGTVVAATVSLALVAAAGVAMATSYGASLDLIAVVVGVLAVAVLAGVLFLYERPLGLAVEWSLRLMRRITGRPRGDLLDQITRIVDRVTAVHLNWRQVSSIVGWSLANWLLDCACFAFSFAAVQAQIPWKGLLLAYGAGQLAANLPITPGGLGAVEGSITIALVAFGGARTSTVEAVLIYRLISFWAALVVGWLSVGALALSVRFGRWPARPLTRRVEPVALPAPAAAIARDDEVTT